MIATVASAAVQYSHTINTLKYADRAKEIKTHVRRNTGTVDTHITEYQRVIDNLQVHICNHRVPKNVCGGLFYATHCSLGVWLCR